MREKCLHTDMKEAVGKIDRYVDELLFFAPSFNLTSKNTKEELLSHAADSLLATKALEPFFEKGECSVADVGSGAGFPAIPLAVFFPKVHFTLIERMSKRCAFLINVKAVLDLQNISVVNADVKNVKERFSLVTFRAFSPLSDTLLKTLFDILQDDGTIAAYKGKLKTITQELSSVSYPCEIIDLSRENEETILRLFPKEKEAKERHLLLFKKPTRR